jgi:hypothetical protein
MRAYVDLRTPNGETVRLTPSDIVGRLGSAALHLPDARISEAHALVSLRGCELKLLALRGRFAVDGHVLEQVVLEPGQTIDFAPGLSVQVHRVVIPEKVLAIEGEGLPRSVLSGVCSLAVSPQPRLVGRYVAGAAAHVWTVGESWCLRVGTEPVVPLEAGQTFVAGGVQFTAVEVAVADGASGQTREGGLRPPIRVEARFDSVLIKREGRETLSVGGIGARILSELVACDGPVSWRVLAEALWPDASDLALLRTRWDPALFRLRKKLRDAGLPRGLVRADNVGYLELVLEDGDSVLDDV